MRNRTIRAAPALLAAALLCLAAAGCSRNSRREQARRGEPALEPPGVAATVAAAPMEDAPTADPDAGKSASAPAARPAGETRTIGQRFPRLAASALIHARPADLAAGELLQAGDLVITKVDLDAEIGKASANIQAQLRKNAFFILEQMATRELLAREARQGAGNPGSDEQAFLELYLRGLTSDARVSDREVADFYERNRDLVGQASLEQVREQVRQYLLQEKKQEILAQYIQGIGRRTPVLVSAAWASAQAKLARDNPVERALDSGKPTFANFGARGCVPCDMMEPVREVIRDKYQGRLNVVFVHVNEEQVLASRYGVQSIPTLVFFDEKGAEVFRHTGFLAQDKIEAQLVKMGLK